MKHFYFIGKPISKKELLQENLVSNFTLINYPISASIKIIPFFEKIDSNELESLIRIFKNHEIDVRTDDLIGKLNIVILKMLSDEDSNRVWL